MAVERGPRVPWRSEEATADPVGSGREEPRDEAEGFVEGGAAGGFLFHGRGVFGCAGDGGTEGEDLVGQAGVDGAGRDGIEIDRLVAEFFGDRFDEADDASLGDAVSREIDAGFGRTAAGEGDDLGAAGGAGEEAVESAERKVGPVEVAADGGAPLGGIGRDSGADFALDARAANEAVDVGPSGGDGGGGGLNLGPVRYVATRAEEGAGMLGGEVGLVGAGEAPDSVPLGEQVGGEGAADAGAGAGENEVHA